MLKCGKEKERIIKKKKDIVEKLCEPANMIRTSKFNPINYELWFCKADTN